MKPVFLLFCMLLLLVLILMIRPEEPLQVADSSDSTITDSITIKKVISLCKHPIPIVLIGLDAGDQRLVGVNPEAKITMQSLVLNKYFPGFQNISGKICSKAFVPDMEEIMKIKPDLIFQWARFGESIAQMESFGFKVVGVNYDGSDQNDRRMVSIMAKALGRETKADSIMQWRDSVQKKIQMITTSIPQTQKPKVIFFYDYGSLRVGGEKCYENFCITLAGGINMGAGLGVDRAVNIEQIMEWDPDIIILGGWKKSGTPTELYQNSFLSNISAVRNKRIIKMPVWASNESPLIWEWMANILHPERFTINMQKEILSTYEWQYKISLTNEDMDQILFSKENESSALLTNLKSKN